MRHILPVVAKIKPTGGTQPVTIRDVEIAPAKSFARFPMEQP